MHVSGFEIDEFSRGRCGADVAHAEDISFGIFNALAVKFSGFGAREGAGSDELIEFIGLVVEILRVLAWKRADVFFGIGGAVGAGGVAGVAIGQPISLTSVWVSRFGAGSSELRWDEEASPVFTSRSAIFEAVLERPYAFVIGCCGAFFGEGNGGDPSDALTVEIAVILACFIAPDAFLWGVGTGFGAAVCDAHFSVDTGEFSVVIAMGLERCIDAIVAFGDFSRDGFAGFHATSGECADFVWVAVAGDASAFDALLVGVWASLRFGASCGDGWGADAIMANAIVGAGSRHGTGRIGDAFFLVASVSVAAIRISVTDNFVACDAT